jgi:hypothetical protein
VSARFERFNDLGTLKYIRTGTVNNLPVLCVADSTGGRCSDKAVVLTLKAGSDSQLVLEQLLDFPTRATVGAIQLHGKRNPQLTSHVVVDGEVYVDIDKFLEAAPVEK